MKPYYVLSNELHYDVYLDLLGWPCGHYNNNDNNNYISDDNYDNNAT